MSRKYYQRTFEVPGYGKVKMRSCVATSMGNLRGWYVNINGKRYFRNCITREQAEDSAFAKWVGEVAN